MGEGDRAIYDPAPQGAPSRTRCFSGKRRSNRYTRTFVSIRDATAVELLACPAPVRRLITLEADPHGERPPSASPASKSSSRRAGSERRASPAGERRVSRRRQARSRSPSRVRCRSAVRSPLGSSPGACSSPLTCPYVSKELVSRCAPEAMKVEPITTKARRLPPKNPGQQRRPTANATRG